ncbi:uncharacterized protein LOC108046403 [Drosophila rhopaloa]|uniref:Uncharacterized protein LOC108046403 n=1 Tax=Drosophila rhopaloa TaxID=1041015 RepID=A0A6P4F2I0_DRORH|nr:uncharacterized protein LOC108046403 [Drosophila rhopaloa]
MNRKPFGLPIWTPLFILFLLFLAGAWGKPSPLVNHHGLLGMYHQQVHGSAQRKGGECFGEAIKDIGHYRPDRSMNPLKAFLSWPGKSRKADKMEDKKLVEEESFSPEETQNNQVEEPQLEANVEPLLAPEDELLFDQKPGLLNEDDWDHFNKDQDQDQDMFDKYKASKSELVNSSMMDYKREFASDEANPFVESLRQRYEPSPHVYSD